MSIRVELELADGSFSTRMIHAGETVRQFQGNVGQAIVSVSKLNETNTTLLGTLRDITVTVGMARAAFENIRAITTGWAGDMIKVNAEMEKLGFLLRGMSSAADPIKEAKEHVKFLREEAQKAPFSLGALTDTFVKMRSTGIDPMKGAFKGMIDAVAAFGGTDDVLKRATVAITQMSGKGVIQMEELRQQLGEAVPRAVELMARSMAVSTGQLIQIIGKGTLESKTALQALQIEFDLTFGGQAQAQMKTFNGMLSLMHTQFQSLALAAGENSFFGTVKKQLGDLNAFLGGDLATKMAGQLGQGLASVVTMIRSVLDGLISFRHEIVNIGMILGGAFLFSKFVGIASSIMGMFSGMGVAATQLGVSIGALNAQMTANTTQRWMMGLMGTTTAVTNLGYAARQTGLMFSMMGAAVTFASSVAMPLAGIIIALGSAFGLLSDKVRDAYEDMEKFGAQSIEQAKLGAKLLEREEEQLRRLQTLRAQKGGSSTVDSEVYGGNYGTVDEEIAKQEKVVRAIGLNVTRFNVQAEKAERERAMRVHADALADDLELVRAARDIQEKLHDEQLKKDLEQVQKGHGDNKAVNARAQAEKRQRDIEAFEERYNLAQAHLDKLNFAEQAGDQNAALTYATQAKILLDMQKKARADQEALRAMPLGATVAPKMDDIDKLLEKAKAKVDEMKMANAGIRAELGGAASGDMAKLLSQLQDMQSKGKYLGPMDNANIKEQIDLLKKEIEVHDELTRKMAGQSKLNAEIERIAQKAQQDRLEAMTEGLTESQKFWVKYNAGAFNGQSAVKNLAEKFGDLGKSVTTSGDEMKTALEKLVAPAGAVAQALQGAGGAFQGIPASSNRYQQPAPFSFGGATGGAAGTIMTESGARMNATNPNSSAAGPGQFIESTWIEFLTKMRPDLLGAGEKAALALRTKDMALNVEATEWLRGETRKAFAKASVGATEGNMYLGHFLGPKGATTALSQSDDTPVRMIGELRAAIKANPEVFSKLATVGDLRAWAEGKAAKGAAQAGVRKDPLTDVQTRAIADVEVEELANKALFGAKALREATKALDTSIEETVTADAGKMTNLAKAIKSIKDGLGPFKMDNRDASDPVFDGFLKKAAELDAAEALSAERKKSRTAMQAAQDRKAAEEESLAVKEGDMNQRLSQEQKFKFSGAYYANLKQLAKEQALFDQGLANGTATPGVTQDFLAGRKQNINRMRDLEIEGVLVSEQQKTLTIEASLLNADEQRQKVFQNEVRRQEQLLALYTGSGEERVAVERNVTRNIAALQRQMIQSTPIGAMMKSWGDMSNNLQTASVSWMNSFSSGLAEMAVKGKFDFKSLADSILKDLIRIGIQWASMKMFTSFMGLGGGDIGGAAMGMGGIGSRHSGGMVDGSGPYKNVDLSAFIGAPRFHTGSGGNTIGGDEIPIIAMKGEQIDWPENLAKQYGGGGKTMQTNHFNIDVKGSAGTQAQNTDLAEKIGSQLREQAKAMVADQIRTQMKPGGLLRK